MNSSGEGVWMFQSEFEDDKIMKCEPVPGLFDSSLHIREG